LSHHIIWIQIKRISCWSCGWIIPHVVCCCSICFIYAIKVLYFIKYLKLSELWCFSSFINYHTPTLVRFLFVEYMLAETTNLEGVQNVYCRSALNTWLINIYYCECWHVRYVPLVPQFLHTFIMSSILHYILLYLYDWL